MNTDFKIAWVHLVSRFRQLMVATLSVTFGISMYIFMNSFMSGVNDAQTDITFTSMAHIRIYNDLSTNTPAPIAENVDSNTIQIVNHARNIRYTDGIKDADPIILALKKVPEVMNMTEQLNQNVFIRNGVTQISASLSGIDVPNEDAVFHISKYMVQGDIHVLEKRTDAIVLGLGLAQSLGVQLGDNITLSTADGIVKNYTICGLFQTGATGADRTKAMVSIYASRQLFSKNKSYVTDIQVNITDYNDAKIVTSKILGITNYKIEPWQEGNSQLESANTLRNILAVAVSLTILIVAGFGIYNIMNMTVNEKIKEIAILKAMGYSGKDIVIIFLTQSVVIGIVGGLIGLLLGFIISKIISHVPFHIATLTTLPIDFNSKDYLMAFVFGLIVTFWAGYLPAAKASKVDPVDIIRG
ncbi:ABC transporter permease [Rhizosphaericola mali]|uniref:ABC transporter permease n=1 Tax=Rhizosphaericola mali TaxID=2545455 RepID=A0A5P2GAF1_9BACT|nr:FtsX-like permease family protein [Rhizosphaericola mali]QES90680.1 ABC transporter permease [Rhizosphaericola mali]